MIKNKFSVLVADRLIKLKDISIATGISRTTLTNLYFRRNQGISFDVLGKLCEYFECSVSDIVEYLPSTTAPTAPKPFKEVMKITRYEKPPVDAGGKDFT